MTDCGAGNIGEVVQSPYTPVQKSVSYAILIVLLVFNESLNIITDSQYAKGVVSHIETVDNSE